MISTIEQQASRENNGGAANPLPVAAPFNLSMANQCKGVRKQEQIRRCRKLLEDYCHVRKYETERILGKRRHYQLVEQRHDVWKYLRALGFSLPVIGHATGRDHSSVVSAFRKTKPLLSLSRVEL